ncbi:MAG: hypothetical protein ACTHM9_03095 [Gemmatimonadales bacterium]
MATRVTGRAAPPALRGLHRAMAVAFAAAAAGCGGSSAQAKAAQTVKSWDATLGLLENAEGRGAVPKGFARQVREAADQEQARARGTLQTAGKPTS